MNKKKNTILAINFFVSVVIGYTNVNGTWQWQDGSTDLNPSYFNTTLFNSQNDTEGVCAAAERVDGEETLLVTKVECGTEKEVCVAPLKGNKVGCSYEFINNQLIISCGDEI